MLYRHKKSGASVLSVIAPQDENKVFGITFRTPPPDSTGIPHILEHSVLCGSRKYPVKEPFVVFFVLYRFHEETISPRSAKSIISVMILTNVLHSFLICRIS